MWWSKICLLSLFLVGSIDAGPRLSPLRRASIMDTQTMQSIVLVKDTDDSMFDQCVGTILSPSYILTAAQCVARYQNEVLDTKKVQIFLMNHNQTATHDIDQIATSPGRNPDDSSSKGRIALLHLSSPLGLASDATTLQTSLTTRIMKAEKAEPVLIVGIDTKNVNRSTQILSFFATNIDGQDPRCTATMAGIKGEECFCIHRTDRCQDHLGKPVFRWVDNRWIQIGITTSQAQDDDSSCVGTYIPLEQNEAWIRSVLNSRTFLSKMGNTDDAAFTSAQLIYACNSYRASCGCSFHDVILTNQLNEDTEEAVPYSWTMAVSIRLDERDEHDCSGSILSSWYILTSASCVDLASPDHISILAGVHDREIDFQTIRFVDEIFIHPGWNRSNSNHENDLALLRLFPPLNVFPGGYLSLTCPSYTLSPNDIVQHPENGSHLVVVGWKSVQDGQMNVSDVLQQGSVITLPNNDPTCQQTGFDMDKQFCGAVGRQNPCYGDLGSPVFEWKQNHWEQVGITGLASDCNRHPRAGIYTRLTHYFDWFESVLGVSLTTTTTTEAPRPPPYACNKSASCGCGLADVSLSSARIVGGEDAVEDSWPMSVSLRFRDTNEHACGGTILSPSIILTAAHCLHSVSAIAPSGLTVAAGVTNRSDPTQIIRSVDRLHVHPLYNASARNYRHDIALLHLHHRLPFEQNPRLRRSCVHPSNSSTFTNEYPKNGTRLAIIGWGALRFGVPIVPEILQQAEIYSFANDDPTCEDIIYDDEIQFCAGLFEGGKDSCQGDSGGGIFQWTGEYWEQVGIVSYGRGCADPESPGVYTRLSYYYEWIESIMDKYGEHLEPGVLPIESTNPPDVTTVTGGASIGSTTRMNPQPNSSNAFFKYRLKLFGFIALMIFFFNAFIEYL